jgi:hypothetical protein
MSKTNPNPSPWCPFCGQKVGRPTHSHTRKMNEFPVGECLCGAVYTCDATGHNVGAAMVEALVYACNDNWDFAWDLMPEDDYLTGRIENYDENTHQVIATKNVDGRLVRGVLYFVRLHTEISDISKRIKDKQESQLQSADHIDGAGEKPVVEPAPDPKRKKQRATKEEVREKVDQDDIDGLVALCFDDKKTLRLLQRLLYDPDEDQRWRIAWLIGQVAARVASREPGQVSELVHRLFEACSDSAATPWGMVETIGSIIAARPDIFGAFTRYLLNYMGQSSTQIQVIWSLAEIAETRPDLIRNTPFYALFNYLQHPEAAVRGQIARLLGRIQATEVALQMMGLKDDMAELVIWEKGRKTITTVKAEAAKALAAIHGGKNTNNE